MHIKQDLTVSIATATFVHYAYRNLKPVTLGVLLVVANNLREVLWQQGLFGKAR